MSMHPFPLQVGGPLKGFNVTLDDGEDDVQEELYRGFFTVVEVCN